MKKIFQILLFASFALIANAQTINQNVKYTKKAVFTGQPVVKDTALTVLNGSDTLRITTYADTTRLSTTAAAWKFSPALPSSGWSLTGNSGTSPATDFVGTTDSVALFLQALKSFVALGFPTQNRGLFVGNIPYLGDTAFYSSLLNYIINADNNFTVTANNVNLDASNNVNLDANNNVNLNANSRTTIRVNDSTYIAIDDTSINVKSISGTTEAGYYHKMSRETGNCFSNIYTGKLDSSGLITDLLRVAVTLNKSNYSQSNAHIFVASDYDNPVEHNGLDVFPTYAQMSVNKTDDAQATGNSLTLDSLGNVTFWSSGSNKFSIDTNGNPIIPINAGLGKVLTSDANGLATWQYSSTSQLDSATIYALTPTEGTQIFCSDCSGSGITGRIVAYIGAAWRRLNFE